MDTRKGLTPVSEGEITDEDDNEEYVPHSDMSQSGVFSSGDVEDISIGDISDSDGDSVILLPSPDRVAPPLVTISDDESDGNNDNDELDADLETLELRRQVLEATLTRQNTGVGIQPGELNQDNYDTAFMDVSPCDGEQLEVDLDEIQLPPESPPIVSELQPSPTPPIPPPPPTATAMREIQIHNETRDTLAAKSPVTSSVPRNRIPPPAPIIRLSKDFMVSSLQASNCSKPEANAHAPRPQDFQQLQPTSQPAVSLPRVQTVTLVGDIRPMSEYEQIKHRRRRNSMTEQIENRQRRNSSRTERHAPMQEPGRRKSPNRNSRRKRKRTYSPSSRKISRTLTHSRSPSRRRRKHSSSRELPMYTRSRARTPVERSSSTSTRWDSNQSRRHEVEQIESRPLCDITESAKPYGARPMSAGFVVDRMPNASRIPPNAEPNSQLVPTPFISPLLSFSQVTSIATLERMSLLPPQTVTIVPVPQQIPHPVSPVSIPRPSPQVVTTPSSSPRSPVLTPGVSKAIFTPKVVFDPTPFQQYEDEDQLRAKLLIDLSKTRLAAEREVYKDVAENLLVNISQGTPEKPSTRKVSTTGSVYKWKRQNGVSSPTSKKSAFSTDNPTQRPSTATLPFIQRTIYNQFAFKNNSLLRRNTVPNTSQRSGVSLKQKRIRPIIINVQEESSSDESEAVLSNKHRTVRFAQKKSGSSRQQLSSPEKRRQVTIHHIYNTTRRSVREKALEMPVPKAPSIPERRVAIPKSFSVDIDQFIQKARKSAEAKLNKQRLHEAQQNKEAGKTPEGAHTPPVKSPLKDKLPTSPSKTSARDAMFTAQPKVRLKDKETVGDSRFKTKETGKSTEVAKQSAVPGKNKMSFNVNKPSMVTHTNKRRPSGQSDAGNGRDQRHEINGESVAIGSIRNHERQENLLKQKENRAEDTGKQLNIPISPNLTKRSVQNQGIKTPKQLVVSDPISTEVDTVSKHIDQVSNRVDTNSSDIVTKTTDGVSEKVDSISNEINPVSKEANSNSTEVDAVTKEIDSLSEEVDSNSIAVDTILKNIESVSNEIEPISRGIEPTTREIEPTSREVELTSKEVKPILTRVEPISKEIEPTSSRVEAISKEVEPTFRETETIPIGANNEHIAQSKLVQVKVEPVDQVIPVVTNVSDQIPSSSSCGINQSEPAYAKIKLEMVEPDHAEIKPPIEILNARSQGSLQPELVQFKTEVETEEIELKPDILILHVTSKGVTQLFEAKREPEVKTETEETEVCRLETELEEGQTGLTTNVQTAIFDLALIKQEVQSNDEFEESGDPVPEVLNYWGRNEDGDSAEGGLEPGSEVNVEDYVHLLFGTGGPPEYQSGFTNDAPDSDHDERFGDLLEGNSDGDSDREDSEENEFVEVIDITHSPEGTSNVLPMNMDDQFEEVECDDDVVLVRDDDCVIMDESQSNYVVEQDNGHVRELFWHSPEILNVEDEDSVVMLDDNSDVEALDNTGRREEFTSDRHRQESDDSAASGNSSSAALILPSRSHAEPEYGTANGTTSAGPRDVDANNQESNTTDYMIRNDEELDGEEDTHYWSPKDASTVNRIFQSNDRNSQEERHKELVLREKLLKAALLRKVETSELQLNLRAAENTLVKKRSQCLLKVNGLNQRLKKLSKQKLRKEKLVETRMYHARQLASVERQLAGSNKIIDKLESCVRHRATSFLKEQSQYVTMTETCIEYGGKLSGVKYLLPNKNLAIYDRKYAEVQSAMERMKLKIALPENPETPLAPPSRNVTKTKTQGSVQSNKGRKGSGTGYRLFVDPDSVEKNAEGKEKNNPSLSSDGFEDCLKAVHVPLTQFYTPYVSVLSKQTKKAIERMDNESGGFASGVSSSKGTIERRENNGTETKNLSPEETTIANDEDLTRTPEDQE